MNYTHVIWDFNGTILSDMQICIDSVNEMLLQRELETIPDIEAYRRIFDFPVIDYYRRLGFDFSKEPYEELAKTWINLYEKNFSRAKLTENLYETLFSISKKGITQDIISAGDEKMLENQLAKFKIRHFFGTVMGLDNIHAAGKTEIARAWRKNNPCAKALFIGDTIHDAESAHEAECDCILFSGGHQSGDKLISRKLPVVNDISEILNYI